MDSQVYSYMHVLAAAHSEQNAYAQASCLSMESSSTPLTTPLSCACSGNPLVRALSPLSLPHIVPPHIVIVTQSGALWGRMVCDTDTLVLSVEVDTKHQDRLREDGGWEREGMQEEG